MTGINRGFIINVEVPANAEYDAHIRVTVNDDGKLIPCPEGEKPIGHLYIDVNENFGAEGHTTSGQSMGDDVGAVIRAGGILKARTTEALEAGDYFKGANDGKVQKAANLGEAEGRVLRSCQANSFAQLAYFII